MSSCSFTRDYVLHYFLSDSKNSKKSLLIGEFWCGEVDFFNL